MKSKKKAAKLMARKLAISERYKVFLQNANLDLLRERNQLRRDLQSAINDFEQLRRTTHEQLHEAAQQTIDLRHQVGDGFV